VELPQGLRVGMRIETLCVCRHSGWIQGRVLPVPQPPDRGTQGVLFHFRT